LAALRGPAGAQLGNRSDIIVHRAEARAMTIQHDIEAV
jgi:hypothetical protein